MTHDFPASWMNLWNLPGLFGLFGHGKHGRNGTFALGLTYSCNKNTLMKARVSYELPLEAMLFIVVPHVRATWDYLSLLVILFRECFRCRLFSQQWCVFLSWSLHDAITSLVNMITKDKKQHNSITNGSSSSLFWMIRTDLHRRFLQGQGGKRIGALS